MKKWILVTAIAMFAAGLFFGGAYIVLAQGGTPPTPFGGPGAWMSGRGWMHDEAYTGTVPYGRGPMMGGPGYNRPFTGTVPPGPMYGAMMEPDGVHEQVWTAIAQELGLTYDQLQTELKS